METEKIINGNDECMSDIKKEFEELEEGPQGEWTPGSAKSNTQKNTDLGKRQWLRIWILVLKNHDYSR